MARKPDSNSLAPTNILGHALKQDPEEQRIEIEHVACDRDADDLVVDAVTASTAMRIKASREVIQHSEEAIRSSKALIATNPARYEALAREHGADLSEEDFNEALRKVSKPQSRPAVEEQPSSISLHPGHEPTR